MNIAQTIPLADGWGMHGGGGGWWIVGAAMMVLFMGGMMWMMMRGMGGGSSSAPSESRGTTQRPVEILERRFAEGAISIEEYQARREALVNGSAGSNGAHTDKPLTAAGAGEGRR
jgi:uncharacterized membrane protein